MFVAAMALSYAIVLHLGSDQYGNAQIYGPWLNWLVALPSWLLGCILAEHHREPPASLSAWRAGIALCASILYWLTSTTSAGFYLTLNVFAVVVFFWIAKEISNAAESSNATLEWIGRWSYSLYLIHAIAATALAKVHIDAPTLTVPASLAASYIFYRLLEAPAHRLARTAFARLKRAAVAAPL